MAYYIERFAGTPPYTGKKVQPPPILGGLNSFDKCPRCNYDDYIGGD